MTRTDMDAASLFAICFSLLLFKVTTCCARVAVCFTVYSLLGALLPFDVPFFVGMSVVASAWWGIRNGRDALCVPT